jgi:hypothetical protein
MVDDDWNFRITRHGDAQSIVIEKNGRKVVSNERKYLGGI